MSEDDFDNIIEYSELCDKYSRVAVDDYDDYICLLYTSDAADER